MKTYAVSVAIPQNTRFMRSQSNLCRCDPEDSGEFSPGILESRIVDFDLKRKDFQHSTTPLFKMQGNVLKQAVPQL